MNTKYSVWIEKLDGSGRIDLSVGTDAQAAADLVGALVAASMGVSFALGVSIEQGTATDGGGTTTTPPPARHAARR